MKKKIVIAVVVTGLALAGLTQAYGAWGGRGGYGGYGGCGYGGFYGNCPQMQGFQAPQLDSAVQEKLNAFFQDTQELRKQMAMKRAEQQALMRSENPDPAAVGKVAGELFDLRAAMHDKAEEAGVSSYLGRQGIGQGGKCFGPGMRGQGRGGRGMGGGYMMGNPGFGGPQF